ncbi:MAG: LLM class flavin-dependent oxidoreductase [Candidatus Hadarchaeaceae archaeon]|nr:LLM class flavin-dependent oxidoreductase [Hadesarchaea archaeon]MDH5685711.1 LLM class flavin-dependent oxidoreductase [Hadesarchaea archaeon]
MVEKKLGYNIRIKGEKVNHELYKEYVAIAKRADAAGLYYLSFPEFFARFDRNRIHVIPYMTAIAAQTEHVKFSNDVLVVPLFHPIHIADIGSSLDIMTNGRFILGVGLGSSRAEYENFGISWAWKKRGRILDESLDIIKKLWTEPAISEYKGKFYTIKNICSPPPVQKPHPPIWVGGLSDAALRRTAQYGNEWAASVFWVPPPAGPFPEEKWDIKERIEKLKKYCKEFGRELVFGRAPRGPKEAGFNQRINVNINPDKEKALEEARHYWVDVRAGRVEGGVSLESKLRYAAIGNAEEVIEKLEEVYKTGAYLITIYPLTTDSKSQWDKIEKEVLPSL